MDGLSSADSKKRKRIIDGTFLSELNDCMSKTRPLIDKKLRGEKLLHTELIARHTDAHALYNTYGEERVCAQELDMRLLQEFDYMMRQANELVWKNAATVCLCLAKHNLRLPVEVWQMIVKPALLEKRADMHAFALRLFKGTEHPTFEVQWVQKIVRAEPRISGERTRIL